MNNIDLSYRDILTNGAAVHVTRMQVAPTRPAALHGHDFYELLWVQNGQVRHHLPGGVSMLAEGDLVFIRPGDIHALQGRGDHALVVSLTLQPELLSALGRRHKALEGYLFWADDLAFAHRDMRQLAALNQATLLLERSARDRLSVEAFLLPLCADLIDRHAGLPATAPEWLRTACAQARDPAVFSLGAAGLVARTGRAHPHVSRTMKALTGQSPTEWINDRRMSYAAGQLSGSADRIADIAQSVGLPNLSHFHKVFRAQFNMTPAQYRRKFQRNVIQP